MQFANYKFYFIIINIILNRLITPKLEAIMQLESPPPEMPGILLLHFSAGCSAVYPSFRNFTLLSSFLYFFGVIF